MESTATAIAPTLILILFGFALRQLRLVSESAWVGMEKLTYYVLFPALLLRNLAVQQLGGIPWPAMLLTMAGTLTAAIVFLLGWRTLSRSITGPAFTSVFQGGVRFNTYIGLSVAAALYGIEGLRVGVAAAGVLIIVINLACVAALAIWGSSPGGTWRSFARDIGTNPLILACVAGASLSIGGVGLPSTVANSLELLSRAALPIGLLTVGAVLQPTALRGHFGPAAISSIAQFLVKPLVAAGLIGLSGLSGVAAGVLVILFVTPAPTSAYILARQLGGDAGLMVSIITLQTLLAFLAMPVVIGLAL